MARPGRSTHSALLEVLGLSQRVRLRDSLLNFLKSLLGLGVAVLVGMQLDCDLVIVLLHVLLGLLGHAFDQQGERSKQKLVG